MPSMDIYEFIINSCFLEVAEDFYVHNFKRFASSAYKWNSNSFEDYEIQLYIIETIKGRERIPVGFHMMCFTFLMIHHLL